MLIFYDVHDLFKEAMQMDGLASIIAYDLCTIASLCIGRFQNEIFERRLVRAHPERRGVKIVGGKTT